MKRESIKLSDIQWVSLVRLAKKTKSVATTTATRQPSWRAMVRRIADGELDVRMLKAVDRRK